MTSLNNFLKRHSNEASSNQDSEYLEAKNEVISVLNSLSIDGLISLGIINLQFNKGVNIGDLKVNNEYALILAIIYPISIENTISKIDKISSFILSPELSIERDEFVSISKKYIGNFLPISSWCKNEICRNLEIKDSIFNILDNNFELEKRIEFIVSKIYEKHYENKETIYSYAEIDDRMNDYTELNKLIDNYVLSLVVGFGFMYALRNRMVLEEYWDMATLPFLLIGNIKNTWDNLWCDDDVDLEHKINIDFMSSLFKREEMFLRILSNEIFEFSSDFLEERIDDIDFSPMNEMDIFDLNDLWSNNIFQYVVESKKFDVRSKNMSDYNDFVAFMRQVQNPKKSKSSSAIQNFLSSNSAMIVSKLKESGLQLSSAALQNDENISRIAGVIHNLLPTAIRFFVSYHTVEKFLLENRYWLIEKLR
ncbi:MAG: hypothetical protein Q4A60_03495 [Pasteurellaceae bacterium]|nr:hypothetical protein [Pasteurellaceae bacterium]